MDKKSAWIWKKDFIGKDLYCDFVDRFVYEKGEVHVKISADSNYAIYINGTFVESGQYADYPHYKIYDQLTVTPFCKKGENILAIVVWHYGKESLCYYPGTPALRYEVWCEERLAACSAEGVPCRRDLGYESGRARQITSQMGYGFHYDISADDEWLLGTLDGFEPAVKVEQDLPMLPRPVKKLMLGEVAQNQLIKEENGTYFLYDLGKEEVGYLALKLRSSVKQKLVIAYGEHIHDGCVRRLIADRDFSVEITVEAGENTYMNPFRRLGLQYLEVFAKAPIEPGYISVVPVYYPLEMKGCLPEDPLDRKIYETCLRTLELCVHEHYEDCPWREQALYCMDSRNQMLCGYYCFEETLFPRANLKLISQDNREDDLLSICFPSKNYGTEHGLAIPSFSLHYYTQMREYLRYTGDTALALEAWPKMKSVLKVFTDKIKDGCIPLFVGTEYWNFYEWSEGLQGNLFKQDAEAYEAALNCLLVIALRNMADIAHEIGKEDTFSAFIPMIQKDIRARFFNPGTGLFYNRQDDGKVSELVNSLAILAGVCSHEEEVRIAQILTEAPADITPVTLSMLCFKYDALMKVDNEAYKDFILSNIREKYGKMLEKGTSTVWETEDSFESKTAASLCHGWSALPIYYYEVFGGKAAVSALYETKA